MNSQDSDARSAADGSPIEATQGAGASRRRPVSVRGRRWLVAAWVTLVVGIAGSLTGAALWRSSARAHDRQSFQTAAANVSATLATLLRSDIGVVETLRADYQMEPGMSASRFGRWVAELRDTAPGVAAPDLALIEQVPAARLRAFQARRDADPAFSRAVAHRFATIAPSGRPRYCVLSAITSAGNNLGSVSRFLQGDWCDPASPIGSSHVGTMTQALLQTRSADSGHLLAFSVRIRGVQTAFVEVAVYRRGAPLATVAQRRAATIAWITSSFDVRPMIRTAIAGNGHLAVALYHANPGQAPRLLATAGTARGGYAYTVRLHVRAPWLIRVSGSATVSGLSADAQALIALLVGGLLSVLLFAVLYTLARSRERALGLVAQRTGELRHQALHDALTGLPNRVLALDRAEQMLARGRRSRVPVAALYVDVDGFKQINDTFGHAAGDELLRIVAQRLRSIVRQGDTAARLGGDEFVVLLEGSALDAGPELVAERLLEVLRQPYDLTKAGGREVSLSASVGIAEGLRDSADALLAEADVALYEAKAAGKNRWVRFQAEMQTAALRKLSLEMDLANALNRDEMFLVYQPIFGLRTQSVAGVEALLRWEHPERGLVGPDEFIPVAEANGLILPLGRWVMREACRQTRAWRDDGYDIGVSVNVSARQLDHATLLGDVELALAESGLDAENLTLEVTETALMRDPRSTAQQLRALKRLGVRIAIDDFGTGYSSLAYLRQFPADTLKIDRSFIADIASSRESDALIHTLVQLGKSLDIQTLAEGIEQQSQVEALRLEGCDQGQGFWFSQPIRAEDIEPFLGHDRRRAAKSA